MARQRAAPSDPAGALQDARAELAALGRELVAVRAQMSEGLARETAMAEVLRIVGATDAELPAVLEAIAGHAARLCRAEQCRFLLVAPGEQELISAAHWGYMPERGPLGTSFPIDMQPEQGDWAPGRAVRERRTVHVADVSAAADEWGPTWPGVMGRLGVCTFLAVPLLRVGEPVGVMNLRRTEVRPFTDQEVALVETFASQAVIAIENARLFQELNDNNATLHEALGRQTATSEILGVIASSPGDLDRVLDAIALSTHRLVRSRTANISILAGDRLRYRARARDGVATAWQQLQLDTEGTVAMAEGWPLTARRPTVRAVVERRAVHVPDIEAVADEYPDALPNARAMGWRASLAVPLLRGGEAVGAIMLTRAEPGPFASQEIALVESFAVQAVIAIDNARLFQELNDANAGLTEALEEQRATGRVLEVIGRSPTDLQTVLETIAESAARLCGSERASIALVEGQGARVVATVGPGDVGPRRTVAEPGSLRPLGRHDTPYHRAIIDRAVVHIHDLAAVPVEELVAEMPRQGGRRTMLAVPLLRGEAAFGAINLNRQEVRPFTEREIALVQTFADQAVIAIENTRLFNELHARDERRRQELERASAIQQRLLPERVEGWPGLLDVAVRFRPAVETSGDFYDVLPLPTAWKGELEPLQIAVGDVAGKGMAAALVTALARSALQLSATVPPGMATPATTLRLAGRRLHADVGSGHFVACALAVVEPPNLLHAGPRLTLSNAAQVPVLLVRGGESLEIEPPGDRLPLGSRPDGDYKDAEVELRAGDVVVFSSDGLVEAPSLAGAAAGEHLVPPPGEAGELFGFARLAASASHWAARGMSAEEVAAGIWSDLTAWCGDQSHHDDMTLLVLRVTA